MKMRLCSDGGIAGKNHYELATSERPGRGPPIVQSDGGELLAISEDLSSLLQRRLATRTSSGLRSRSRSRRLKTRTICRPPGSTSRGFRNEAREDLRSCSLEARVLAAQCVLLRGSAVEPVHPRLVGGDPVRRPGDQGQHADAPRHWLDDGPTEVGQGAVKLTRNAQTADLPRGVRA